MSNKVCSIDGCDKVEHARGWCGRHYRRWLTTGDPASPQRLVCKSDCMCGRHADNKNKGKVPSLPCVTCGETVMVTPSRAEAQKYCSRACYEEQRRQLIAARRASGITRIYDMPTEEFESRLAAQGHQCAICMREISGQDIHRDHCHTTGEWRGLLCGGCNKGLGLFRDDPSALMRAAEYLVMGGVVHGEKVHAD